MDKKYSKLKVALALTFPTGRYDTFIKWQPIWDANWCNIWSEFDGRFQHNQHNVGYEIARSMIVAGFVENTFDFELLIFLILNGFVAKFLLASRYTE